MSDNTHQNFYHLLSGLERSFAAQLARIKGTITPKPHAPGLRKPDLEHTEARLIGHPDYLDGAEDDE